VLGYPIKAWQQLDLAAARGVAMINGQVVGEGLGADALGHPFNAVAWIANHLAAHGRGLLRGDVVITGSLITTKYAKAGDFIQFSVDGLGEVELRVD
jgi:2-keto-4-pentenoate hydratase